VDPVLLTPELLLLPEPLLELLFLKAGAEEAGKVCEFLVVVDCELMACFPALQSNLLLMQTSYDIEVPHIGDLLCLVVDLSALVAPLDLVQYLRRWILSI